MSYAVIGSGAIGSAIARAFARKSIPVGLANSRGPGSIVDLVTSLGGAVMAIEVEEALKADIVILAIPYDAVPDVVAKAADWAGRMVVDATNAIEFPSFKPRDLGGRLSTEIVSERVRGAGVVKAFNTIPAAILATDPEGDGGHRALFVSGDDAEANAKVAALAGELGFAAIDLGKITEGGRLQQFGGALVGHNLIKR